MNDYLTQLNSPVMQTLRKLAHKLQTAIIIRDSVVKEFKKVMS